MSLFVVYKSALHGQQFPCQTGKGNRMKHLQIYQGLPVWSSGVARVAELGGQAGGKGLHQGGKRTRARPEVPTAYRRGV